MLGIFCMRLEDRMEQFKTKTTCSLANRIDKKYFYMSSKSSLAQEF